MLHKWRSILDRTMLGLRQEPAHCLLPFPMEQPFGSRQVDQIDANAENAHQRAHHQSTNGRSCSGTRTYPPSTSPT